MYEKGGLVFDTGCTTKAVLQDIYFTPSSEHQPIDNNKFRNWKAGLEYFISNNSDGNIVAVRKKLGRHPFL